MSDLPWTHTEKRAARLAFDTALARESAALLDTFNRRAAEVRALRELWALEDDLARWRRDMDEKYDFRYSRLVFVLARLLREGWLRDADLDGLDAAKREAIRALSQA